MHIEFWVILGLCLYGYNVECFSYINLGAIDIVQCLEVSTQETSLRIWGCIPSTHKIIKWTKKKKIWCFKGRYLVSIPRGRCRNVLAIPVIFGLNEETLPQWLRRWRVTNKTDVNIPFLHKLHICTCTAPHSCPNMLPHTHILHTHIHI